MSNNQKRHYLRPDPTAGATIGELLTEGILDLDNPAHWHYFGDDDYRTEAQKARDRAISDAETEAAIAEAEEWIRQHGSHPVDLGEI